MWRFKQPGSLNTLPHTKHLCGLSPLWIVPWFTRWRDAVNRLPQTVHSNAFTPEWLRRCTARSWPVPQHFPHSAHLYLPLWTFRWRLSPLRVEKRLSHSLHAYQFSPVCIFWWIFKHILVVNRPSHSAQAYGLEISLCWCSVWLVLSASVFIST